MSNNTKDKLEHAIEVLVDKINHSVKSDDALRYTQSALNTIHVLRLWREERAGNDGTEKSR